MQDPELINEINQMCEIIAKSNEIDNVLKIKYMMNIKYMMFLERLLANSKNESDLLISMYQVNSQ